MPLFHDLRRVIREKLEGFLSEVVNKGKLAHFWIEILLDGDTIETLSVLHLQVSQKCLKGGGSGVNQLGALKDDVRLGASEKECLLDLWLTLDQLRESQRILDPLRMRQASIVYKVVIDFVT